ncbi:MAG: iron ABC transporter permease, partial [Planctomycetota bacterium]|nr:iron ABC transporter permease [Planctomycetota bacterium]
MNQAPEERGDFSSSFSYLFKPSLKFFATLVTAGMLLPLIYLGIRGFGAGTSTIFKTMLSWDMATLIGRSLALACTVSFCALLVAVPAAIFSHSDMPLARLFTILFTLPHAIPSYVGAMAFIAFLGPGGLLEEWTSLSTPSPKGFFGACLTLTVLTYPYIFLPVRSALLKLDPSFKEAARGLGLSPMQSFIKVTLPLIKTALFSGALLVMLYALSDFGAVSLLQFESFTQAIFSRYDSLFERQAASIISMILVAITALILLIESWVRGKDRLHGSRASVRKPEKTKLGTFKIPALIFSTILVTVSLFLPLLVVGTWFVRGLQIEESMGFEWRTLWSSFQVAGLAALASVLFAIPVAYLNVRHKNILTKLSERVFYIGFALPGIVIALALVRFGRDFEFYQTLPLLIFAYVLRFLPQALGSAETSLLQSSPSVEEAAQALGRNPIQVFFEITRPLMMPGLKAGAILVFLTTIKELPATKILSPLDFETLATRIWDLTEEGFFAAASAP